MVCAFLRRSLFLLPIALAATPLWADGVLLHPDNLVSKRGTQSDQPLTVLAVEDQKGSSDDWHRYKEFYVNRRGYAGIFSYDLPTDTDKQDVTTLELLANYRGAPRAEQRWLWQVRNLKTGKWVLIGDNKSAGDWVWTRMVFALPGDPRDFIDDSGRLAVRYLTKTGRDNSNLDYLALRVETSDASPPPMPPTPPPDDPWKPLPPPPGGLWQPLPGSSWQWQLQGAIDTTVKAEIFDIDLFDVPQKTIDTLHAKGSKVICYFSAGSWENWRPDANDFPDSVKGRSNGWPGEKWLDIRQIDVLAPIVGARLDLAVEKGCDAVEPDNIDGYSNNTGFPLGYQDQLAYNRFLADEAHARGLSIALKNDLDQVVDLVSEFDFAVNEQCFEYNECDLLLPFVEAGKAVLAVEYQGSPESFCPKANQMGMDVLKKRMDLDAWRIDCHDYP